MSKTAHQLLKQLKPGHQQFSGYMTNHPERFFIQQGPGGWEVYRGYPNGVFGGYDNLEYLFDNQLGGGFKRRKDCVDFLKASGLVEGEIVLSHDGFRKYWLSGNEVYLFGSSRKWSFGFSPNTPLFEKLGEHIKDELMPFKNQLKALEALCDFIIQHDKQHSQTWFWEEE